MHRAHVGLTVGFLLALAPGAAWAQSEDARYLAGGGLFSVGWGNESNTAIGGEGSFTNYPGRDAAVGVGAVLQAQIYLDGSVRVGAGLQSNVGPFGTEIGFAYRTGSDLHDGTFGLHVAPFFSTGYVSSAFRFTIPLAGGPRAYRTEYVFAFSLKYVSLLGSRYGGPFDCVLGCAVSGRPLLDHGHAVTAPMIASAAWSGDTTAVGADDASIARLWERAAREEHASIAAFARLSLQLMSLGAPPSLLAKTHGAALDEIDHARRCSAIASRLGTKPVSPGALPGALATLARVDLATLAVESLVEGCLGEGSAAAMAREGARTARDPAVREALSVIADDEARHAALAWEIVDWCLDAGGAPVREALFSMARALPARMSDPAEAEALTRTAPTHLEAHGLVSLARQRSLWARTRREVLRRLALPRANEALDRMAA
jgi:hypothetical protein